MVRTELSETGLDGLLVSKEANERFLTQKEANELLGVSQRKIRRLLTRMASNAAGIKSKKTGGESHSTIMLQHHQKLSNTSFVQNAPEAVVPQEQNRLEELTIAQKKLSIRLTDIQNMDDSRP